MVKAVLVIDMPESCDMCERCIAMLQVLEMM